jgi:hypothetical protein
MRLAMPRRSRGTELSSGNHQPTKAPEPVRPATTHSKDRDMGSALRSVWQKTVEEKVPDDMLDLLGKLG